MHDMARVRDKFYEMFDAISSKQDLESGEQGQQLQVLCSAFFMLLLSNTNKTAVTTTHVTNNNLTVQASHITVMQEMNGLKSALAQRTSQLEQWTSAWEENMKMVQSRHADQSDAINDLEAELIVSGSVRSVRLRTLMQYICLCGAVALWAMRSEWEVQNCMPLSWIMFRVISS